MSQVDIHNKTDIFEKLFPGETPAEALKRVQQQVEFMRSLPSQLLDYQTKLSSRKVHTEPALGQENPSGLFFSYQKSTAGQSTPRLEQGQVLLARSELVEQAIEFEKIEHLAPAGRRLSVNRKP